MAKSLGELTLEVVAKTRGFTAPLQRAATEAASFAKTIRSQAIPTISRFNEMLVGRAAGRDALGRYTARTTGAVGKLRAGLSGLGGQIRGVNVAMGGLTAHLGILGGAAGFGGLSAFAIKSAADLETTKVAFETMLGSAKAANKTVGKLFEFSKKTPFEPTEVFGAGRQLLAAGFSDSSLLDEIKTLGDLAAGSGSRLGDLAFIYGKIRTKGKASLEEINQLTERSINLFPALKKVVGASDAEIRKMISAGRIGLPEVAAALRSMTSEGGMFAGAMERQSKTLNGLFSTLKGNIGAAAASLGTSVTEAGSFKEVLNSINSTLEATDWKAYGKAAADAMREAATWIDTVDVAVTQTRLGLLDLNIAALRKGKKLPFLKDYGADERAARIAALQDLKRQVAEGRLNRMGRLVRGKSEEQLEQQRLSRTTNGGVRAIAQGVSTAIEDQLRGVLGASAGVGRDIGRRAEDIRKNGLDQAMMNQKLDEHARLLNSIGGILQNILQEARRRADIQVARPA